MAKGKNLVVLVGNLGADPDLKYTQSGTAVMKINVATAEKIKKGDEWTDRTEWHRVVVWSARAEGLSNFLRKGMGVFVQGRLRTHSWEDKDGVKKYATEVIADDVIVFGGGKSSEKAPPYDDDNFPEDF